jgi:hypothetical protein
MSNRTAQVAAVSDAVRTLHRTLLGAVRAGYERLYGPVADPFSVLQLALHDPLFAWLRPMSSLNAQLDALVDEPEAIDDAKLADVRATLERWTSQREGDDDFASSYRVFLQTEPEVVMAHAVLRSRLAALPQPPAVRPAQVN